MKEIFKAFIETLYVLLPAILANIAPVFVGGGQPIHEQWFGAGKTWRGLLISPFVALLGMFPIASLAISLHLSDIYDPAQWLLLVGLSLGVGFGALTGDLVESYLKRRRGIPRGEKWPLFDQLDFVVGGLVGGWIVSALFQLYGFTTDNWLQQHLRWYGIVAVAVLMPAMHRLVNMIGYALKLKKVPW